MIPISVPNLNGNEDEYLQECVDTNWISTAGSFVGEFEEKVADAAGTERAVATSTGTSALHLALLEAGVSDDDLVILPSLTFIASANAISYCGADPWLVDINESLLLDSEKLERALDNETTTENDQVVHDKSGRTVSAIMPVHTLGHPADMEPINQISKKYNLPVVADGAAALGTTYKGKKIGKVADFTTFSFNGNKTVTCGGGGAVVSKNKGDLEHIKHLSTTARVGKEYHHDEVGFNYRMTNLEAAVGCAQLEQLDGFIASKKANQERYNEAFREGMKLSAFKPPEYGEGGYWYSIIFLTEEAPGVKAVCKRLEDEGIQARPFWKPIHLQPPYQSSPTTDPKVADQIWDSILTLPCSTDLSSEDQDKVISTVRSILDIE